MMTGVPAFIVIYLGQVVNGQACMRCLDCKRHWGSLQTLWTCGVSGNSLRYYKFRARFVFLTPQFRSRACRVGQSVNPNLHESIGCRVSTLNIAHGLRHHYSHDYSLIACCLLLCPSAFYAKGEQHVCAPTEASVVGITLRGLIFERANHSVSFRQLTRPFGACRTVALPDVHRTPTL